MKNMIADSKFKVFSLMMIVAIVVMAFFLMQSALSAKRYRELANKEINSLKKAKKDQIDLREIRIEKLKKSIFKKDFQIKLYNRKIDSLEVLKQKVVIKYVDKQKKISGFSSEQIKNYWKDEFNK